jgi:hypothetical protein
MYSDFIKEGLLPEIKETSTFVNSKYNSKYFTGEKLNEIRAKVYKDFYIKKATRYLNPITFYREFLSKIRSYEDLKYVITIFKNLLMTFSY